MSQLQTVHIPPKIYLTLKGLPVNGLPHHVINLVRNVFWNYLCLIIPTLQTWETSNSVILNTLSTRVESSSWCIQQGIMYCIPTLSLPILGVGTISLSDSWPWLLLAPSAAQMLPSLLSDATLSPLNIALAEEASRWGSVVLLATDKRLLRL
jgi:hypothetical protein